ncbi:unnamed protein product [Ectocarpus sp. CCAP 1310/34]|nr:unnamed protein product [Ectocarpus sp. CCAP 1310/34]
MLLLTQSALNSGKKIMGFVMDALDPAGSEIVRARAGGGSALTSQQLWLVPSIFPFLLAPIFSSPDNLGRYVRAMVAMEVADRISVEPVTPAGKAAVCNAFQDLVKACSWSCFVVRSPSFTAEGLHVLQNSQQEQVKQATRVIRVALGTIHKGLDIARNLVVNGVVTNCNVGEAKNKELKASAPSASGRNNARHIWRATNDSLAIKSLADGIEWTASGWTGSKWERRTVTAGDLCRQTLQDVFSVLPLAPALSDTLSAGRSWGNVEWDEDLLGTEASLTGTLQDVFSVLPLAPALSDTLSAGRSWGNVEWDEDLLGTEASLTGVDRADCPGLHNGSVTCFNHWGNSPEEASAGTGTLRGGPVKDAAEFGNKWMIQETSRANDVGLYVDTNARRFGEREQAATTLGRIAYCFEHQGNDSRHLVDGKVQEGGEWTIWVAVEEYITAGRGQGRKVNHPTGCDVFYLRSQDVLGSPRVRCLLEPSMDAEGLNDRGGRGRFHCGRQMERRAKRSSRRRGMWVDVAEGQHLRVVGNRYLAKEPGTGWVGERACARVTPLQPCVPALVWLPDVAAGMRYEMACPHMPADPCLSRT